MLATERGAVDLFIRNAGTTKALKRLRFKGSWQAIQTIEHPDILTRKSYGFSVTSELDLFTVGKDKQLWHRKLTNSQLEWEQLGGQLGDHLTGVSRGSNVDVFAIWNDVALLHRKFDAVRSKWFTWKLVDIWPGSIHDYNVLRPKDLVNLNVYGIGLKKRVRPDGIVELVPEQADARLIVEFPPQHVGEVVEPNSIDARIAGPSRLAFSVSQSESVPLT
ncbi:hypothetical protein I8J38_17000, partial [Bacillus sp. OA1]|nr:hypothetical protein [Bacillus sp. OA1]